MYRRWTFGDQVGTVNVVLTENGTQTLRRAFTPFGQWAAGNDTSEDVAEVFAGHKEEHYLGIVYMGARWYDMSSGRFMSIDPEVSDISNPQTLNPYGYVENNPVNQSDPTGSVSISIFVNGTRGAVVISGGAGNIGGIGGLPGGVLGCGFAGCTNGPGLSLPPIIGIGGPVSGGLGFWGGPIGQSPGAQPPSTPPTTPSGGWVNPTGKPIRGCDMQGCGGFRAPRRTKAGVPYIHRGADYLATPGQNVVSPVAGVLVRNARPYPQDPRYGGALIRSPSGYEAKLFYVDVDQSLVGSSVAAGATIGTAQDISVKDPGASPHVHTEIHDPKGNPVDPSSLIPP